MLTNLARVCVIGGGISGLSSALILQEAGIECSVFEQRGLIGGLVSCSNEEGSLFHRVGGHVFNSKKPKVHEWFWNKFDRESEFLRAKRKAVILIRDTFVDYPIELHLSQLEDQEARQVFDELLANSTRNYEPSNYASLGEFMTDNFGDTLYSIYFKPYNNKIWKRDLGSIPLEWLDGKLPMISPKEILYKNIFKGGGDDMVHSFFYYPKRGGSQFIVDRIAQNLDIINEAVLSIDRAENGILINGEHNFSHVVYTGDIRQLPALLARSSMDEISKPLADNLSLLPANATTTMLCECDANEYSWVYLPSETTKIHRIIMTGNFSPHNNREAMPPHRSTCTVEHSGQLDQHEMETEIKKLPFSLAPIAYNYCDSSYIIHNHQTQEIVNQISSALEAERIYLCGRFAEWKYYNMDAAIESAMTVASRIIRSQATKL